MFTLTFQQLRKANPDEKVPQFWGRPRRHPGKVYVYRAVALFLLMLSAYFWLEIVGYWALGLTFIIAAIPAAVLNTRHNRRVQTSGVGWRSGEEI
jgi:hypothetical protein